ncbi:flavodoxin domain-containing protein [Neobacillus sp. YIM B06451]|uniref:flavodoxin domain-containing protein n=1 Tax=Neobacillus sp. YIM B06451 TaxID=3070994 RepID=UPI0029317C01|nr:flavodoxin domain-containing protein [Neobacillus sp. YIM B06451]
MALTNYEMEIAIVYTSVTGNTRVLAENIKFVFQQYGISPSLFEASLFPCEILKDFDAIAIATYTWGNGEVPSSMHPIYEAFEQSDTKHVITGIAGTGDSFYPHFCGAVDAFRDMLFVQTTLAATLKVELAPQDTDLPRCRLFVESILKRVRQRK